MTTGDSEGETMQRMILIGCSKTKHPYVRDRKRGGRVLPAELYAGQLFSKRVEYAESRGLPWFVLSAAFGMWRNDTELNPCILGDSGPYDKTLIGMSRAERAAWHIGVANSIVDELWEPYHSNDGPPTDPADVTVEIHAGQYYVNPLAMILESLGFVVELPCKGLGIGKQLAAYTTGRLSPAKVTAA